MLNALVVSDGADVAARAGGGSVHPLLPAVGARAQMQALARNLPRSLLQYSHTSSFVQSNVRDAFVQKLIRLRAQSDRKRGSIQNFDAVQFTTQVI